MSMEVYTRIYENRRRVRGVLLGLVLLLVLSQLLDSEFDVIDYLDAVDSMLS